jgi:CRISPR-associated endonuclease/helicase Cas3
VTDFDKMEFWAKTTPDGRPGLSVFHHTRNVGNVAYHIALHRQSLFPHFKLTPLTIAVMAALHDIGKISQGFQSKCPAWLERNGLTDTSVVQGWQSCENNHAKVSQFTVQNLLLDAGILEYESAYYWAVAVGAHHGYLHRPSDRDGLKKATGMSKDDNLPKDVAWEQQRQQVAKQLIKHLGPLPNNDITPDFPGLWWLAGLISVADWIGSDTNYFPADQNLELEDSKQRAWQAVEGIGFACPAVQSGLKFSQLFPPEQPEAKPLTPNDLQLQALAVITESGIYAIEAPMGMGKTEAALACAYRLLAEGKASGIYFALPTQVTSNRIHKRVNRFIQSICSSAESPSTRLIHANSWLMDEISQPKLSATAGNQPMDDARAANDWFASPKRALLAPFGVGTVDQALLAVVAAKHFFVRRFGLAGKVVIIDEVHSYDFYTGSLIQGLCKILEALHCTVILLSATLTPERRTALLGGSDHSQAIAYPLITGRQTGGAFITPRPAKPPKDNPVHIHFKESNDAMQGAWIKAKQGACVLWICDTISSAQDTYARFEALAEQDSNAPALGLLHSRFPYYRREELEEKWMEALGKDGATQNKRPKNGCVLVSTQVVEQSVDLDADLLVTELAPTDMLLQRIGRLWRHERGLRPVEQSECWIVQESAGLDDLRMLGKEKIREALGAKAWVYAPYVLLRTLEEWSSPVGTVVQIPSDIRNLLENTYIERENEPKGWVAWKQENQGDEYSEKMMADMEANIWSPLLTDEEGKKTRLIEIETVQLIMAQSVNKKTIVLLNGETADLSGDAFQINAARALHRNVLKVDKRIFSAFKPEELTKRYVKGQQAIAIVQPDGTVTAAGLKSDKSLHWHHDRGLEIRRGKEGNIDHESCD